MSRSMPLPLVVFLALIVPSAGRGFMSRSDTLLDARAIRQELDAALSGALGHGHGIDPDRIASMNATVTLMFRALPQNSNGRIGASAMRYLVQRYFSTKHGWVIKGFETHANRSTELNEGGILGSKVPGFIEASLEKELLNGGFGVEDVLTMIVVLERLIFDEVTRTVETSYSLNGMPLNHVLDREGLQSVLESYLIVEMLERHTTDKEEHEEDRANIYELYPNWDDAGMFVKDIVNSEAMGHQHIANPFVEHGVYSFDDTSRIAQRISDEYGPWGNQECVAVRDVLIDLDTHNTGRVSLTHFYNRGLAGDMGFHESPEYLRQLGALDESSPTMGPQVLITNYVYGMSNCLSSTPYYSVCCMNGCEGIFQHFVSHLAKPTATPADILRLADQLTSSQNLSTSLRSKLEETAALHNGEVALHGRLFAQWLHYAFPHTCPYPHAAGTVKPQTQSEWMHAGKDIRLEDDEMDHYLEKHNVTQGKPALEEMDGLWSFEEEILVSPEPQARQAQRAGFPLWLSSIVPIGILLTVMRLQKGMATAVVQRLTFSKAEPKFEYKSYHV